MEEFRNSRIWHDIRGLLTSKIVGNLELLTRFGLSETEIRALQGSTSELLALLELPETLEALVMSNLEETNGHATTTDRGADSASGRV